MHGTLHARNNQKRPKKIVWFSEKTQAIVIVHRIKSLKWQWAGQISRRTENTHEPPQQHYGTERHKKTKKTPGHQITM